MNSPGAVVEKRPGIRWWPAFYIVGLIGVAAWIGNLHFIRAEDRTKQMFVSLGAVSVIAVLLTLWWILFSRARWWLRLILPAALIGGVYGTVRFDGFTGELIPLLSWNWKPAKGVITSDRPVGADIPAPAMLGYSVQATDWPGFRGADRRGVVKGHSFDESWLTPKELWRVPVGDGWSSFAVVGPLAWTQEQQGGEEVVVCFDAATGGRVWSHSDPVRFYNFMGGAGPRATPTYHEGKIYTLGATGWLNCFEAASGKLIWTKDTLADAKVPNIEWGMAGSPLIFGDTVIVSPGGTDGNNVIAYDLEGGDKRWGAGAWIASYAAPQLATIHGHEQLLIHHGNGMAAYDPVDGKVLWTNGWTTPTKINVAQPTVYGDGSVMLSCGYGRGSILFDVEHSDGAWTVEERWRTIRMKSKLSSFVLKGSHVYGFDENYLVCLDIESGTRMWKGEKVGYGQLLLIGEVLLVLAESGEVVFVRADPVEFAEIGRFKALEGKTWNHPVVANNHLYVRNGNQAACFELTKTSAASAMARN